MKRDLFGPSSIPWHCSCGCGSPFSYPRQRKLFSDPRILNSYTLSMLYCSLLNFYMWIHCVTFIIRPHHRTMYVDAAYCYQPSSMVCLSVCWCVSLSVCHTNEPCKNGWSDWDAVWVEDLGGPKEPCIRWGPDPPMERDNFQGGRGIPLLSIGTLCSHLCKNCWTDRNAVWFVSSDGPRNHVLNEVQIPMGRGNFGW